MKKLLLSGFLLIIAATGFAQAPNISYTTPQVYVLGKTITNLVPANSGGAVPATIYSDVTTLAGNGTAGFVNDVGLAARFQAPYAIASDAAGNIYVADYENNAIRKVTPAGLVSTFISTGLSSPAGVAVGADGNIYIADTGNQLIKKATPAGVVTIIAGNGTIGSGNGPALTASFSSPQDVAVNAAGDVYVADFGNNQIRKISAGVVTVWAGSGASGLGNGPAASAKFKNPFGLDVDAAGNVYVADFNNSAIRKITPGGVVSTLAGNGVAGYSNGNGTAARFNKPGDVAVDAIGNVFVTDSYNSVIRKISPNGDVVTFAGAGGYFDRIDGIGANANFGFPIGITFDPSGNMYVADDGTNCIRKAITTGYFIDKDLPAGLVFDPTTGIISGTPTDVAAAANYTIFAYNNAGSISKTISIAVRLPSTDATLSGLTASVGSINPAFVATGKRYVINVANSESGTTVTPVLNNLQASLTVNGLALASGAASNTIPLNLGNNDITIKVTAEDGLTISNYQVSVVRAKAAIPGPVISYNTTNNFPVNVTIPNLAPTNTGGAVPAISYGEVTTFATGVSQPWGIATDAAGNVYVTDAGKQIRKITPAGAVSLFTGTGAGLNNVSGLGSDAQGNIYVADAGNNKIRIISSTGTVSTLAGYAGNYGYVNGADADAEFANPQGVAVDGLSNIYIADTDTKTIRKRTLDGQVTLLAGTGATGSVNGPGSSATFTVPLGIASDFDGNVFVADLVGQVIRKITPAGQVTTFAGSGAADELDGAGTAAAFNSPAAVAVDPIGTIYVADAANSKIRRITPSGEVIILAGDGQYRLLNGNGMSSSFSYPLGVAADQNGHLFVADYGNNAVRKIETLGYGIYPHDFLPAGLVFDNKTGIISGKPTTVTPSRSYKITAYNLGGSSVSNITIRIINITNEARLSNVALNFGTLSPAFASATTTYSASVTKTSIIITPTAMDAAANIKINGVAVVSGAASTPVPLLLGANAISIVVTATDGVTQKTYTLNVTRTPVPPNADLSGLTVSAGTLNPAFASGTADYTIAVSNATTTFIITPTSPNSLATIQVNGAAVASGAQSTAIPLTVGLNTITTIVTDENGNNKTYTIQVTRAASVNADLASLGLSDGSLTQLFNPATLNYTAAVANTVTGITITPTTADATATIKVNGVTVASGVASATIPLNVGANVITSAVTAQDGTTLKTYSLTVTRAASTNADLSALALSQGTLSPAFGAGILVYSASVTNSVTSITVTPTASDVSATIQVNGVAVSSGTPSATIPLNVRVNVITTVVTAEDGTTKTTYTTNVTRAASTNADLSALSISAGTLSPVFASGATVYTAAVSNATTDIAITPTGADVNSVITVNGTIVTTGTSSLLLPLAVGDNNITVQLTAEDGVTINTYTITVTRAPSDVSTLSSLTTSAGPITVFDPATLTYAVSAANGVSSATITPTTTDANAIVTVNGTAVTSGSASAPISLNVGLNTITTVVTAQDGVTTKTYTVDITRAASPNADLSGITLNAGTLSPAFTAASSNYTVTVTGLASITVTPTQSDAGASIMVNGTAVTSGTASQPIPLTLGGNPISILVTAADGTIKNYLVTVDRMPSADALLTNLVPSAGTLSPAFAGNTGTYSVSVGNTVTTIKFTPTLSDANATLQVNGVAVANGTASQDIPLVAGTNAVTVTVTAENGAPKNYTVNVVRAGSADATLSNLTVNGATILPAFASGNTDYGASVANTVTSVTLTPIVNEPNATITVNGSAVTSGSASAAIPLVVGANAVTVVVTAQDGSTTKTYTVTVNRPQSSNADLASLTVSSGTLSPTFASGFVDYLVRVGNGTTSISLTPASSDAGAVIRMNSTIVSSGSASGTIPLVVGDNVITVQVTAEDATINTYTITVNRAEPAASTDANLASLTVSTGTLTPPFAQATPAYTIDVPNTSTSIGVTPTSTESHATITVNGTTVASGTPSGAINLNGGSNIITTIITAQDGTTTKTYTITVTRAPSTNADLANITLSAGTLNQVFAAGTISYTADVSNAINTIRLTPTTAVTSATIKVNGVTVASGAASAPIPLNVGPNAITTIVTAESSVTKTYTVTVTRAASPNADLANLTVSAGTLNPVFAAGSITYNAAVGNAVTTIRLTPTVADAGATVKVNGVTVASGTASAALPLVVGPNVITTTVTAQDGTSTQVYTTTVTRVPSSNAFLTALGVSSGTYNQSFGTNIFEYTMLVTNNVTSLRFTPVLADNTATITVNGVAATNGVASALVVLAVGNNFIETKVTAQDGVTVKTYTVIVNRAVSSENDLSALTISAGTLTPAFQSGINGYKALVNNATTSLTVKPTVADATATVKVNNVAVASGTSSAPIALTVGINTVSAIVTAQNGVTNTYTIEVTREASANADLSNLISNAGTFTQGFSPGALVYSVNVSNTTLTATVTPTASDATATITINGITVASGVASPDIPLNVGANAIPVTVKAQAGNTKTYTVTISRLPSSNADLAGITVSGGTLNTPFVPGNINYTTIIGNASTGVTVTPNTRDATSTVTVNGAAVTPGTASNIIPLTVGDNTITIIVKAQDGTIKTYTIITTREASANADLTNLAPDAGTLLQVFAPATQAYTVSVVNTVTSIKFTPTVSDATASVKINGVTVASGTASANIPLALGPNTVTAIVTAQNNTTKQYIVTVTRERSSNADLSNLVSNAGALDRAFSPGTPGYSVNVSNTTLTATVTPTASDANATIKVAGQPLASGAESATIPLALGDNPVAVAVTAQNGDGKIYTVTIHRAFSNNANLGDLQLSPGTLSSPFASGTTHYDAMVPFATNQIKITPSLSDGTATVTVNGAAVNSGTSSGFVDLAVGQNTINVVVTAADGTPKTYTVVVTREEEPPSADASLSSLFLTQGELTPAFNRTTYSYTATVQSNITKTNVVAISTEANAKITINGVPVASGASSGDILLSDGANPIIVLVTAEDGTTVKRYTIVVTRASFAMVLPNIFTPNGDGYNDTWALANINLYPNCTVKIFNRGGQQVFNSVGYGIAWDGTFNGRLLPADTYYYIIDLKHGQGVRSGSVTIIR